MFVSHLECLHCLANTLLRQYKIVMNRSGIQCDAHNRLGFDSPLGHGNPLGCVALVKSPLKYRSYLESPIRVYLSSDLTTQNTHNRYVQHVPRRHWSELGWYIVLHLDMFPKESTNTIPLDSQLQ